ncbi:MAG: hypothetical protein R2716_07920 [Microthrixaceae bacterium]
MRFFTQVFPAAVWTSRRFVAAAAACFVLPAVAMGFWLANDTAVLGASVPPELQRSIAESEFRDYTHTTPRRPPRASPAPSR